MLAPEARAMHSAAAKMLDFMVRKKREERFTSTQGDAKVNAHVLQAPSMRCNAVEDLQALYKLSFSAKYRRRSH
jgi:hypothetical protein